MTSLADRPVVLGVCSAIYGIFATLSIYYGYKGTHTDPTDPIIYVQRKLKAEGKAYINNYEENPHECQPCKANVSTLAKHCSICNRCVNNFDHHCKWLNNCVGTENYTDFLCLVVSIWLCTVLHTATDITMLVAFYTPVQHVADAHIRLYCKTLYTEFTIFLAINNVINAGALFFTTYLFVYHIMLGCKGMSTFDYLKHKER
jgi:palmitoyltransferase ZDHHC1/11